MYNEENNNLNNIESQTNESIQEQPVITEPLETPTIEQAPELVVEQNQIQEQPVITEPIEPTPVVENQPPLQSENTQSQKTSKNNLIIIVIILIVLGIGIFLLLGNNGNKTSSNNSSNNKQSAFFIKNKNNKAALFSVEGKKLTDFIYDNYQEFTSATTNVEKNGEYGIINSKGKTVVTFGKYKSISKYRGRFYDTDGEYSNMYRVEAEKSTYKLLNNNGKELYDLSKNSITEIGYHNLLFYVNNNESKQYDVIDKNGELILKIPMVDGIDNFSSVDSNKRYFSIFYNNKTYIIDLENNKKVLTSFESTSKYCLDDTITEEDNDVLLISCVGFGEKKTETTYKLIKNGKVNDITSICDSAMQIKGSIYCIKDNKRYLLKDNLTPGIELEYNYANTAYMNNETYIENASEKVIFYNNGKKINEVTCRKVAEESRIKQNVYILKSYYNMKNCPDTDFKYELYNAKGEKIGNSYKNLPKYEDNNLASVTEDEKTYYLVDENGKKVSEDYTKIKYINDNKLYIVGKNNKYGLLDNKGKTIIKPEYDDVYTYDIKAINLAVLYDDSNYIIYNADTKKEIKTLKTKPIIYDYYFKIEENNKTIYYAYNGKKFYEE